MSNMHIRSPKELALIVIEQRKKMKLTQTELANLIGLKQKTISAFENKPERTKLSTLFYILSAVNLYLLAQPKEVVDNQSKWKEEW